MLSAGETNVKLLLPEVAVVHAHMTLSGQSATDPVAPRAALVSFVVHRIGERWLCASAQSTDLIPEVTKAAAVSA